MTGYSSGVSTLNPYNVASNTGYKSGGYQITGGVPAVGRVASNSYVDVKTGKIGYMPYAFNPQIQNGYNNNVYSSVLQNPTGIPNTAPAAGPFGVRTPILPGLVQNPGDIINQYMNSSGLLQKYMPMDTSQNYTPEDQATAKANFEAAAAGLQSSPVLGGNVDTSATPILSQPAQGLLGSISNYNYKQPKVFN